MATTQKIRYSDCDPQGIVFNANYPRYWDDAVTDWLEELGFGGEDLGGIGASVVTARLEMDFEASTRLGDTLETAIVVEKVGNTSLVLGLATSRLSDGAVVARGREVVVTVDPAILSPVPVPEALRAAVS